VAGWEAVWLAGCVAALLTRTDPWRHCERKGCGLHHPRYLFAPLPAPTNPPPYPANKDVGKADCCAPAVRCRGTGAEHTPHLPRRLLQQTGPRRRGVHRGGGARFWSMCTCTCMRREQGVLRLPGHAVTYSVAFRLHASSLYACRLACCWHSDSLSGRQFRHFRQLHITAHDDGKAEGDTWPSTFDLTESPHLSHESYRLQQGSGSRFAPLIGGGREEGREGGREGIDAHLSCRKSRTVGIGDDTPRHWMLSRAQQRCILFKSEGNSQVSFFLIFRSILPPSRPFPPFRPP
jgi:hypothetical protein